MDDNLIAELDTTSADLRRRALELAKAGPKTPERSPDLPEDIPQRPLQEPEPDNMPDDISEPGPDAPVGSGYGNRLPDNEPHMPSL